jgi:hypothetical protein
MPFQPTAMNRLGFYIDMRAPDAVYCGFLSAAAGRLAICPHRALEKIIRL